MPKLICLFMVFGSGFVAALNMSRLVSTNPDYDAAWWKVGLAVALAIMFGCMALAGATDD